MIYELHIKSGIESISPQILNTFLRLSGYNANDIACDDNIIRFDNLKDAQKAEIELRQSFSCYIIGIDSELTPPTNIHRIIRIKSFKGNGKWYDEFDVKLPYDIQEWDIPNYIRKIEKDYFIYQGHYANNVPFLVLSKQKPVDEWNTSR